MLTESEKQWLEMRDAIQFACGSYRMPYFRDGYSLDEDWKDAAEFSERVAAKLADMHRETMLVGCCEQCPAWELCNQIYGDDFDNARVNDCKTIFLKYARLAVEEEMDAYD